MATDFSSVPQSGNSYGSLTPRNIFVNASPVQVQYAPSMIVIDSAKTRDTGNTPTSLLRAGLLLGKVTASGKYAASIMGVTGAAYDGGTTFTLPAAVATELARRVGSTGTFKATGPVSEAGTVRTLTATYSAVNTSTGAVTVTAMNVNEVQTLNFTNSPSGTFRIGLIDKDGKLQYTQPITYNSTAATLVSNINTALDAALGAGLVVASGAAVTAIALTFSGAGYAATAQPSLVTIDTDALTAGDVDVTRTTTGVNGAFAAGSLIQPTDGSETPLTVLDVQYGVDMVARDGTNRDQALQRFLRGGDLIASQIINLTEADASVQTYLKGLLLAKGSTFTFDNDR